MTRPQRQTLILTLLFPDEAADGRAGSTVAARSLQSVESALDAHERGDFRESGRLVDALLADEIRRSLGQ